MSSIDQQFIEYIVKSLVGNPDQVKIDRRIDEKGVLLELTVDPEDLGRVIGKRGATAQSLRTLLRALGTKNEARYNLKIVDNGEPRPPRDDAGSQGSDDHHSSNDDHQSQNNDSTSSDDNGASNDDSSAASSTDDGDSWASSSAPKSKASDDLDLDDEDEIKTSSDKLSKTREELNDLDDLDI
jgi:predicted RNA-binding protein YlqC (UPF0109 family)